MKSREVIFDKNRENSNSTMTEQLVAELQKKTQQIEQLAVLVQDLQNQQSTVQHREKVLKEVRYMSTFTGKGEVTINSCICNVEYYLGGVTDESLKKLMVRIIFYEKIQGEAKNVVINTPQPDNWDAIKGTLKLRYKPDTEPTEIYRRITGLKVNNVSELAIEIQNIKYKTDELITYYGSNSFIDLSNVESILVNTTKEMCQGVLLDKIYNEKSLNNIVMIMRTRNFEDECIRPEFRRNKNNFEKEVKKLFNRNKNSSENSGHFNNEQNKNRNSNSREFTNRNFDGNFSGQQRQFFNRNFSHNNNSGQFRRPYGNSGNFRGNSGQNRHEQNFPQPRSVEPMEVDNIQRINTDVVEESNNINFFMN